MRVFSFLSMRVVGFALIVFLLEFYKPEMKYAKNLKMVPLSVLQLGAGVTCSTICLRD